MVKESKLKKKTELSNIPMFRSLLAYMWMMIRSIIFLMDRVRVRALSDVYGDIANTYTYDAFGNITEQTGDTENSLL